MKKTVLLTLIPFITACSFHLQNINSEGTATDLVDDNDSVTPTTSIEATVPITP